LAIARADSRRTSLRALAFLALGFGLAIGLMKLLDRTLNADSIAERIVQHELDPRILGVGAIVLSILPAIPIVALMWLTGRRRKRDTRLDCPHCYRALLRTAAITGNCQRCGEEALILPGEPRSTQPLWTVEEFNVAARNRMRFKDPMLRDPRLKCPECQA